MHDADADSNMTNLKERKDSRLRKEIEAKPGLSRKESEANDHGMQMFRAYTAKTHRKSWLECGLLSEPPSCLMRDHL